MTKRITVIDGHPGSYGALFCHALANAYAESVGLAGHSVRRLTLAQIEIAIRQRKYDWETGAPSHPSLGFNAVFLAKTIFGVTTLWMAILDDTGATMLVTENALRLLRGR